MLEEEVTLTQDETDRTAVLLITANVGSLFEDPTRLLQHWLAEFFKKVSQLKPQFLALHLQEVGGKTYEKSMEYVQKFIKSLCEASEMQDFAFIRIYMDEDFKSAEYFTALGNLYFAHKKLTNIKLWNFQTYSWETADGKCIYSGNIEAIATKEKSKFPKHFFPECKWSRKGFMRTRWEINETVIDLVNIHLFHDASNLAACEEFPSVYCKTRRRALVHTLEKFHLDEKNGLAPYFVFGDFNFRCDTEGVIEELTENLTAHRIQSTKSDSTKVHYRNSLGNNVLTIGKKEFNHADHQLKFKESWLKKFDRELEPLNEILVEYPINFCPSYPYEEDPEMPSDYMSTRCPSWCDRILMSPQAKEIILDECPLNHYSIIGENVCMGDHKPIYLNFHLKAHQGTYRCCKCYLVNNAQNNSTSEHVLPAVAIATKNSVHCPYKSQIYNEIMLECKKLNANNVCAQIVPASIECAKSNHIAKTNLEKTQIFQSSLLADKNNVGEIYKYPPVSINLIDSDNIHVCVCSHISSRVSKVEDDNIDGSMCPDCRNIIKRQPIARHYQIISKRLMLSNDIIVNRIDTQHLNTFCDNSQPYTPESAESHSPYPEPSSTTSTSSHNRSPYDKLSVNDEQSIKIGPQTELIKHEYENECDGTLNSQNQTFDKQNRGIVTPGQLKSRLEDLQRSSTHSLKHLEQDIDAAGWNDVETVNATTAANKRRNKSRLPDCCSIN